MKTVSLLKKEAASVIEEALKSQYPSISVEISLLETWVVYPEQLDLGHVAIPCHPWAKTLKLAPNQIAEQLAQEINKNTRFHFLNEAIPLKGYLNFKADTKKLFQFQLSQYFSNSLFKTPLLDPKDQEKMIVEYSQPNTHKALHVGHLRNMIYGDAVCNLLVHSGHEVVRATYPGDLGAHIAKSLWYIQKYKREEIPAADQAAWLGMMYAEADQFLKTELARAEGLQIKLEMSEVLRELEEKKGPHFELYQITREWSLDQMRQVYQWLGIQFDRWYFESECDLPSRELVKEKLEEGFFTRSEGAVGIDLGAENLGFVLFLKSDGAGLYITKDLELFRRKYEDTHAHRSIVIVDARQKLHFKQLFKTAEKLGYPHAEKSIHLAYESVTDENGKACSSRDLSGVQLSDLKRLIHSKILTKYLDSYRGNWSDAEIETTANQIALGALKYGFLKVDSTRVIRFILDDWIQLEGDTGPYLQYTTARCHSILEKLGWPAENASVEFVHPSETELLLYLERFDGVMEMAAREFRPSIVCTYLFDLCKLFNRFYKECPIKTAESPVLKEARLNLVVLVHATLKKGLNLLGIPTPKRL